jgi:hypothetical protein
MIEERRGNPKLRAALSWVDRRHLISVRSAVVAITVWMTWEVTKWAFAFAYASKLPGLETAAVIGAVTGPFSILQAAIFKFYMAAKDGNP